MESNKDEQQDLTAQEQFDRDFDAWLEHMERRIMATRESEHITAEDLQIIVY